MAKAIEDRGHLAEATKPLRLKRYQTGKLPDPGQCVDCLIIENDAMNGLPRAWLCMSNGATWDRIGEVAPSTALAVRPAEADLMPMMRSAVEQALPALMPKMQELKVIQAPQQPQEGVSELAAAVLELSQEMTSMKRSNYMLEQENAELRARVEHIELHAIVSVETKRTA